MAVYIKFDGIDGESTDSRHQDWIDVGSYSWGVSRPGTPASGSDGGRSHEKADFEELSVSKLIDKSSPTLYLLCATGAHIPKAELSVASATGEKSEILSIQLHDVSIARVSTSGDGDSTPVEEVGFVFEKITWTYKQTTEGDQSQESFDLTGKRA